MPKNPALDTKVKALKARMLNDRDFAKLISADSLHDVLLYLRDNTHYAPYLKKFDIETVSRADIEGLLSQLVIDNAEKLLHYILGADRNLINLIIQQINLQSLLVLLRALSKGEDLENIVGHLSFQENSKMLPVHKLIKADSWSSFKDALRSTIYYRSLETYSDLDSENLFELEKTLNRVYYDLLYKRIKELNNSKDKELINLLRSEIDMLNLIWIYRAKKFYNFTADEILPYIYRGGLVVTEDDLRRMAEIADFDDFLTYLHTFKQYEFLFDHHSKNLDLHMNRREERYLYFQFDRLLAFGSAVAAAYSYLRLLIDEISDIISIIEAKRYNLNKKETETYLIRRLVL